MTTKSRCSIKLASNGISKWRNWEFMGKVHSVDVMYFVRHGCVPGDGGGGGSGGGE